MFWTLDGSLCSDLWLMFYPNCKVTIPIYSIFDVIYHRWGLLSSSCPFLAYLKNHPICKTWPLASGSLQNGFCMFLPVIQNPRSFSSGLWPVNTFAFWNLYRLCLFPRLSQIFVLLGLQQQWSVVHFHGEPQRRAMDARSCATGTAKKLWTYSSRYGWNEKLQYILRKPLQILQGGEIRRTNFRWWNIRTVLGQCCGTQHGSVAIQPSLGLALSLKTSFSSSTESISLHILNPTSS